MKRKILLGSIFFSAIVFISQYLFSQTPTIKQWDYRFGGTDNEDLYRLLQTNDEGYLLGGNSISNIGGDKTQDSWGAYDYWIVKLDSNGTYQWDKRFGGSDQDWLAIVVLTNDNGYILGGSSMSGVSGDKTQPTQGESDYWIVKLDESGNEQWNRRFGGASFDWLSQVVLTNDGGYILGGQSLSDSGGNKTQDKIGWSDYWIIKIDSAGNELWDKDFGGDNTTYFTSIIQTNDKGYLLGGSTNSEAFGDKTQPSWGSFDYWIIKTDSLGNKLWDGSYGGIHEEWLSFELQNIDGSYFLGGLSCSNISGNKTCPNWDSTTSYPYYDFWLVKIDTIGEILGEKDYGGIGNDFAIANSIQTDDGGLLLTGASESPISGDKTESNLNPDQTWIIKIDSLGNKQWDKTLLTTGDDFVGYGLQMKYGCYVFANCTPADTGGYKTQPSWGGNDYWIIKFCPPAPSFISNDPSVCEKFCTNFFDQSTNDPTSWLWQFPGGDPSSSSDQNPTNICYDVPGTYDVTLITTNGNGSDTLTLHNYITVYPTPAIPTIAQNGNTLTSSSATSYQWQLDAVDISGATSQSHEVTQTGFYTVVVSDSNGCQNSTTLYVEFTGIDEVNDASFSVYPNPSNGNFIIEFSVDLPMEGCTLSILNALGQEIYSSQEVFSLSNGKKEIHLDHHGQGVCLIHVKNHDGFEMKKILVVF